jgi:hypothetical protein
VEIEYRLNECFCASESISSALSNQQPTTLSSILAARLLASVLSQSVDAAVFYKDNYFSSISGISEQKSADNSSSQ